MLCSTQTCIVAKAIAFLRSRDSLSSGNTTGDVGRYLRPLRGPSSVSRTAVNLAMCFYSALLQTAFESNATGGSISSSKSIPESARLL